MDAEPLPILKMAEEYRARTRTTSIVRAAQSAAASTAQALGAAQSVIDGQRHEQAVPSPLPVSLPVPVETAATKEFILTFLDQEWIVTIDLANDSAIEDWLDISQNQRSDRQRLLKIRVNLAHPFMQRFSGASGEQIEPMLRVAAALAIAETIARDVGVRQAGTIRQHVNELLRKALSAPSETNDDQVA